MKIFSILLFFSLPFSHFEQVNQQITDARDGNTYDTIHIGNLIWFQEDLRYVSEKSYCATEKNKEEVCSRSNYYAREEAASVCPEGWRLPTWQEWEAVVNQMIESSEASVVKDSAFFEDRSMLVQLKGLDINAASQLKFDLNKGWVEGKRIRQNGSYTLWINNTAYDHNRFHLHLGATSFVGHHHEHHVVDKVRKVRRFCVRCVKEKEE
ncbi:MAG: FISUMP domain-containing protein [Bacteroidota bacterium]